MSKHRRHHYRNLAKLLAQTFDDGSEKAIQARLAALPTPGSDWAKDPPPEFPMPWASHWGEDLYGLWCAFSVGEVIQRMRWIPPGEFWMGSPDGESERYANETLHSVTIITGYWLAETACSQALWFEVTGKRPSHFSGNSFPVEEVSWDDVQDFCARLDTQILDLQARLPTEVEWEYACRAGTESPFWWGSELTQELANYNGLVPYADGPKEDCREVILPVNYFESNPWGLYQMHGNVWEWCEELADSITEGLNLDTIEVYQGPRRIVRGGSWTSDGQFLRSANYGSKIQSGHDSWLGFRLAAGPHPSGAQHTE